LVLQFITKECMQSKQSQKQSDNLPEISETVEIDLQKIVQILKRHWLFGTGVFAVLMLIILLIIVRQKPSYRASGTVLVQKPENQSLLGLGVNVGDLDSLQGTAPIVTQTELVKAVPLIQQTIDKLGLTDSDGSTIIPEDFLKKLRIESVPRADVLKVTYTGKDPQETAEVINTLMQLYVDDNLKINRTKVTAARKFIEQQLPRVENSVREIEDTVRRFNESNRIVSLEDESKAAIDISNTLDKALAELPILSVSIVPLTRAPSSSATRGAVILPITCPALCTITCSVPEMSPSTSPSTWIVLAAMLALTRPLLPTVTIFLPSSIVPSTLPRTSKSSAPEMLPLTQISVPIIALVFCSVALLRAGVTVLA